MYSHQVTNNDISNWCQKGNFFPILLSCKCNHCHALMLSYLPDRATQTRRLRAADSHKLVGNLGSLSHVLAISVALEPRAQWRKLGSRRIERGWRTVPLRSMGAVENIDFENPPPPVFFWGASAIDVSF